jgi:hypothetical protein
MKKIADTNRVEGTIIGLHPITVFDTDAEAAEVVAGWDDDGTWAIVWKSFGIVIEIYDEDTGDYVGTL